MARKARKQLRSDFPLFCLPDMGIIKSDIEKFKLEKVILETRYVFFSNENYQQQEPFSKVCI